MVVAALLSHRLPFIRFIFVASFNPPVTGLSILNLPFTPLDL